MATQETFAIGPQAARTYEDRFVPAIFAEWAPVLTAAAGVAPGQKILDVACGTGVVARTAADLVGDHGTVVGVDANPAMLDVARRVRPDVDWHRGDVTKLPFPDGEFDATLCQMAFMFFPDPVRALREMARVTEPGGRVALVVPAALEDQPAYRVFVARVAHHAGPDARSLVTTYFAAGDLDALVTTCARAGLHDVQSRTRIGTAKFASAADFVDVEVQGSPLAARIDTATDTAIKRDVADALGHHASPSGTFEIPLVCHVVVATA